MPKARIGRSAAALWRLFRGEEQNAASSTAVGRGRSRSTPRWLPPGLLRDNDGGHLAWPLGVRFAQRISAFDNVYAKYVGFNIDELTKQQHRSGVC